MIFKAISNILMDFLKESLALVLFLVLDCDYYQSFDYCTEQVEEIDVVHGEDSSSGLVIVGTSCCKPRRRHVPAKLQELEY